MARRNSRRQADRFFMNNCKIANELRKYRDLAGCLNQVALSGERVRRPSAAADYAEYYISETLSYLDMVTANAAYTLMAGGPPDAPFQADEAGFGRRVVHLTGGAGQPPDRGYIYNRAPFFPDHGGQHGAADHREETGGNRGLP